MSSPTPSTHVTQPKGLWRWLLAWLALVASSWQWQLPALLALALCLQVVGWWWLWRSMHQQHQHGLHMLDHAIARMKREQANKDEMLAVISHELRTPMNVLLGLQPRIREGVGQDATVRHLLDPLQDNIQRLLGVLNTILDASHRHAHAALMQAATDSEPSTVQRQNVAQQSWHILVVDDSPVNLLVMRLMLQKLLPHALVDVLDSGRAAMAYLETRQPNLLFVDVRMPDVDGYALAQWVRQHPNQDVSRLPMVALTGQMRAEDAERRTQCGIHDVVYKPLDEHQLSERLCQWLVHVQETGPTAW